MYEPRGGKLELVGVEYIVIAAAWDAANKTPPTLMGQLFHLQLRARTATAFRPSTRCTCGRGGRTRRRVRGLEPAGVVRVAPGLARTGSHERLRWLAARRLAVAHGPDASEEMAAELAHVDVIVDDHITAHGMLGEPGGDLLSPVGAGRPLGVLSRTQPVNPCRLQHLLQLGDGLAVPPGGRDDDVGSAGATISFST